jgi:Domain of unknown function (DUF1772)
MEAVAQWVAIISAGVFSSWALYVSIVEHPARMSAGAAAGVAQFRESYQRAAPWQATAAALSLIAGAVASWLGAQWVWVLGGLVVALAIPFTLLIIMPTNRRLLSGALDHDEAMALLSRWGQLHAVRSALGIVGVVALLWTAHAR